MNIIKYPQRDNPSFSSHRQCIRLLVSCFNSMFTSPNPKSHGAICKAGTLQLKHRAGALVPCGNDLETGFCGAGHTSAVQTSRDAGTGSESLSPKRESGASGRAGAGVRDCVPACRTSARDAWHLCLAWGAWEKRLFGGRLTLPSGSGPPPLWLESQAPSGQEMTPGHTADAGRLPSPLSPLRRRHGDPTRQGPSKRPRPSGPEAPCLTSQGAAVRRGPGPFPGPCCPEAALSEGPASTAHSGLFLLGNTGRKIQFFRLIPETLLRVKKY